ncbi:MAG: putative FAD-linked oxidoreductase [Anaerosporomusa subterranea]|jgi:glycolate oxidase|nr:putative FAD-linked oxidoreductase [Anaerosporomusa subterranea]
MSVYNPVTSSILDELKSLLGEKNVTVDPDKLYTYSHDEVTESRYHHMPEVVVFPETTEQVAAVVKLANRELIPVTPRGAGTGLACGAVPNFGGIVLSTEKMNKILEVNAASMYMIAEAGARTEDVQQTAKKHGLLYAGDPCSGDSCFIGGNVATNAGGNKAVKYGTTRHQVYSVEVVTPKGDITNLGARLNKSSTGYSLDQLIIGSEGTLGIITKVTLKLVPLPQHFADFLAVFPNTDTAIAFIGIMAKAGITPTTVEFMDTVAIKCSEAFINEKLPHDDGNYLIIQIEADDEEKLEDIAVQLDELCTDNGATTLLMLNDSAKIWKARKSFAEAVRHETLIHSNEDIVVPIDKMPEAMHRMAGICEKYGAAARTVSHAGDGNIHLSILQGNVPEEQWIDTLHKIQHEIFDFIYPLGGKLSGEHGIGYKKKDLMQTYTDPVELDMMRSIKKALDPNWILNPDKLFDRE